MQQLSDIFSQFSGEDIVKLFAYDANSPLLFNTWRFLGLFLLFYLFYILLRNTFRARLVYTIFFSLYFYFNSSGMLFVLLLFSSVVDYTLGYFLYSEERTTYRKIYLWFSVIANLTFLGYFKYTNFIIGTYNDLFGAHFEFYKVILPVGISFYTFQSISYIIEIYRKEIVPTKTYVDYLFFVSFFPQLVAGPIVRAKDFIPQIYAKLELTREDVNRALFLIIGGLIKKTVISDYISINFVDRVFDLPNAYTPFENLMAAYGYTIQIYCDFSGYSDMAIGIALLLGFKLPTNFRTPYNSSSITEFWRRWHISLSTWLKDFLYISVGGNRNGSFAGFFFPVVFFLSLIVWGATYGPESNLPLILGIGSLLVFTLTFALSRDKDRTMFTNVNLMTTMLLGGLWHGASLRFIIWGALHGMALAVHKLFAEYFPERKGAPKTGAKRVWNFFSIILTFHFVAFCWLFFRAKDFPTALEVINNISLVKFAPEQWQTIIMGYKNVFLLMLIGYVWHFLPDSFSSTLRNTFDKTPLVVKGIILGLVYWLVYAAASAGPQPFIYFQF